MIIDLFFESKNHLLRVKENTIVIVFGLSIFVLNIYLFYFDLHYFYNLTFFLN